MRSIKSGIMKYKLRFRQGYNLRIVYHLHLGGSGGGGHFRRMPPPPFGPDVGVLKMNMHVEHAPHPPPPPPPFGLEVGVVVRKRNVFLEKHYF